MDVNDWCQASSVVLLWTALLLRARSVISAPHQRSIWLAVSAGTTAMTLTLSPVTPLALRVTGSQHTLDLTRNLIGVLSAGAVLYFVVTATSGRRFRSLLCAGVVLVMSTLLLLDRGAAPHREHAVDADALVPSLCYWLVLSGAHLVADTCCGYVCIRYAAQVEDRLLGMSLRLFGLGTLVAACYWLGCLLRLRNAGWLVPCLPPLMALHGLLRAAALLLPTLFLLRRLVVNTMTIWNLWPFWRDLVEAVPQVTLTKPRPRLLEVLWPQVPRRVLAYRKVIESRDAILVLQNYVPPPITGHTRHLAGTATATKRGEAAFLARVLRDAREAKLADRPQLSRPVTIPGLGSQGLADETSFLIRTAKAYRSLPPRPPS